MKIFALKEGTLCYKLSEDSRENWHKCFCPYGPSEDNFQYCCVDCALFGFYAGKVFLHCHDIEYPLKEIIDKENVSK